MIVDEKGALERVGGDTDLLREWIEMCAVEGPKALAKLEAAIAARDAKELHIAAHTLKGSVSIFCAQEAYDAAFVLENLAKAGTWESVDAALTRVRAALAAVLPELARLAQR